MFSGIEGKMERLSTQTQESGFASMQSHSQRSSSQSYTTASSVTSKRSSQQSTISFNSKSFSSQQQSFSQQKISSDSSNGSVFSQRTITSSRSTHSTTNITGNRDAALLEKLVNVGVVKSLFVCLFFYFTLLTDLCSLIAYFDNSQDEESIIQDCFLTPHHHDRN